MQEVKPSACILSFSLDLTEIPIMAKPERNNFRYYIAELLILVLGISLSFILNEYRVQKQEEKMEIELLDSFRDNLILDSLALHLQIKAQEVRAKTTTSLLNLTPESEYSDSMAYHMVILLNYGGFYPTDITYQEMRSLGNSHLIQNQEMLNEIIQLYEGDYDLVAEWSTLDKNFMTNQLMPYVYETFPFARKFSYHLLPPAKKREMMRVLTTDRTKNMIQNCELTLLGSSVIFERVLGEVRRIIDMLNSELGGESEMGKKASDELEAAMKAMQDSIKNNQ